MIREFQGDYRFLSNFWEVPIPWQGKVWPTSEHIYQAMKFDDLKVREIVRTLDTPAKAKRFGKAGPYHPADAKVAFMMSAVYAKFVANTRIKAALLATGEEPLVEGNNWGDRFWGVSPVVGGTGQNMLGKVLMYTRDQLRGRRPVIRRPWMRLVYDSGLDMAFDLFEGLVANDLIDVTGDIEYEHMAASQHYLEEAA